MNLVNYRPATRDLMNFDRVFNNFLTDRVWNTDTPAVDVRETEDAYELQMDLPGRTEKDLEVNVTNGLLTISSKTDEKAEEKKDGYVIRERKSSNFSRCFKLPQGADAEKISAEFTNGVLGLSIPKSPAAQPKKIEVKIK